MKTITFAIPEVGVGKTVLQVNVAAALAMSGKKVIILDADPMKSTEKLLSTRTGNVTLLQVIQKNSTIKNAIYETEIDNLFLLPSGLELHGYFDVGPVKLARKLMELDCDFLFLDSPLETGESAFIALGISQYLVLVLSEEHFSSCVEDGIDLAHVAKDVFNCKAAGFIVNKLTGKQINDKVIDFLEKALKAPCISRIEEDPIVKNSFGKGPRKRAYLFYQKFPDCDVSNKIGETAKFIETLPEIKKEPAKTLQQMLRQVKR